MQNKILALPTSTILGPTTESQDAKINQLSPLEKAYQDLITSNKRLTRMLEQEKFANEIIFEISSGVDLDLTLTKVATKLHTYLGCEALGLRINKNNDAPYYTELRRLV